MLAFFIIAAVGGGMFHALDRAAGAVMSEGMAQFLGGFIALFVLPQWILCVFLPQWSSEAVFSVSLFAVLTVFGMIVYAIREAELAYLVGVTVVAALSAGFVFIWRAITLAIFSSSWMWYEPYRGMARRDKVFAEFGVVGNYPNIKDVPNKRELAHELVNHNLMLGLIAGVIVGIILIPISLLYSSD